MALLRMSLRPPSRSPIWTTLGRSTRTHSLLLFPALWCLALYSSFDSVSNVHTLRRSSSNSSMYSPPKPCVVDWIRRVNLPPRTTSNPSDLTVARPPYFSGQFARPQISRVVFSQSFPCPPLRSPVQVMVVSEFPPNVSLKSFPSSSLQVKDEKVPLVRSEPPMFTLCTSCFPFLTVFWPLHPDSFFPTSSIPRDRSVNCFTLVFPNVIP